MTEQQRDITHVLYSQDTDVQKQIEPYVKWKKGDFFHYLHVPNDELKSISHLELRPYIKNSCSHGIVRAESDGLLDLLTGEISKRFKNTDVTVDMKRSNWYHIKFNDLESSVTAVGSVLTVNEKEYVIEKWKPKAKHDELKSYLKYLLWDNYQNDLYLQTLASKHKNWVPVSNTVEGKKTGIVTFKWIVNKRVRAARIKQMVQELGGKVSNNGRFVTTDVIQQFRSNN